MMRGMLLLVLVLLALVVLLPAASWHRRRPLPYVATGVPSASHVAACQRYADGWDPSHSDRTLQRWLGCMRLRP